MHTDYMTTKRECKYAGKCGACQTLNLTYEAELSMKMKKEITLLGRFGHVEEIIHMATPLNYRNKVQYLMHYNGGRVKISHCLNEEDAYCLKEEMTFEFPSADIEVYPARGLCSFYAENGGLLIGFEK